MKRLHAPIRRIPGRRPIIARIAETPHIPRGIRRKTALLVHKHAELEGVDVSDFAAVLVQEHGDANPAVIFLPDELRYLSSGDVVRVDQGHGELRVLFQKGSRHNALFFTERCNSRCLMCSQPPRNVDDSYRIEEIHETIKLLSPATRNLGITGGEPTLDPDALIGVLRAVQGYLPQASVYCLTNGRLLAYASYVAEISTVTSRNTLFCIPLYSSVDEEHDFIVQAEKAFDQTVRGIMNCGRFGVPVEIRVVIHRLTFEHLVEIARFIARNLPFVDHVAFMGMEVTGFALANLRALWVDPMECALELARATDMLSRAHIPVSVYNIQHCVLPRHLWPLARRSISDWKKEYMDECRSCAAAAVCGGFFGSGRPQRSRGIRALGFEEVVCPTAL